MLIQTIFLFILGTELVQAFGITWIVDDKLGNNCAAAETSPNNVMVPDTSPQKSNQVINNINSFANDLITPDSVTNVNNQTDVDSLIRLPRQLSFEELTNDTIINCKINSNTISEQITKALAGLTKFINGMVAHSGVGAHCAESVSEPTDVIESVKKPNADEAVNLVNTLGILGQLSTPPMPPKQIMYNQINPITLVNCGNIPTGEITLSALNPAIISEFSPDPASPVPFKHDVTKGTVMLNAVVSNPTISDINALTIPKTYACNDLTISNNLASPSATKGFQGSFIRRTLEGLSSPQKIFAALTGIDTADMGVRAKLCVKSSSPIVPTGISLLAEHLVMDGKVAVMGNLPFLSSLTVGGTLPNSGKATVLYECGRGNIGIISEDTTGLAAINNLGTMNFNNGLPVQNMVNNNNDYTRRTGVFVG